MENKIQKFNINDNVTVKLTEYGAEILNNYFNEIKKQLEAVNSSYEFIEYFDGDTYRCQLWHLMRIFGGNLMVGSESPFENCEIELM